VCGDGEDGALGLKIDTTTNEVIVDHAVQEHLHTTDDGNPVRGDVVGAMQVDSIFRRKKASGKMRRDRSLKTIGDNCPLIYALKQQQGLWVSRSSIKTLNVYLPQIVSEVCDSLNGHVTCIVTIPSQHPLAGILAKRISRNLRIPVFGSVLRKNTFFQASRHAATLLNSKPALKAAGVSQQDEKQLRNVMKKGMRQAAASYSSKDVGTKIREHFDPLRLGVGAALPSAQDRVLLVDDLMATGETLLAGAALLRAQGILNVNRSVTWFSKV